MVGKLMKHELRALFRILPFVAVACFTMAAVSGIILVADEKSAFGWLFGICAMAFSVFLVFAAYCVSVTRFTKSMYSGEGYLTFSLPVTSTQLLFSKIISAVVATLFCSVVAICSILVCCAGMFNQFGTLLEWLFGEAFQNLLSYLSTDPLLIVEMILIFLAGLPLTLILSYLVISVGQLFVKHRVLITCAITFGFAAIAFPILNQYCFEPITNAAYNVSPHLSNWLQIIVFAGVDIGSFFLVRFILTRHVNLVG